MKLSDYRQSYYDLSGASSAVTRQASFAGIALVWIFNAKTEQSIVLPADLLWPTLFLVACLASDLLHYIVAAAIWGFFHRLKERQGLSESDTVSAPIYLNWPTLAFFWAKHIFVILGYSGLLLYVYSSIRFGAT